MTCVIFKSRADVYTQIGKSHIPRHLALTAFPQKTEENKVEEKVRLKETTFVVFFSAKE